MKLASIYSSFKRAQHGSIMVFFVMLIPVLFGFMGLAIDFGLAYVQKGKLQDVADATALAAAVHLGDQDDYKMLNIKDKVVSTVTTNGLQVPENAYVEMAGDASDVAWDNTSLPDNEDIRVLYGIVTVKNSEGSSVDRVRVRITKRSPIFFLGVLGDFSDGLIVSAKAAAEGDIETIGVTDDFLVNGPAFVAYGGRMDIYSSAIFRNNDNNGKGFNRDIYAYGVVDNHDNSPLKTSKMVYATEVKGKFNYDEKKQFQKLDDGSVESEDKKTSVNKVQNDSFTDLNSQNATGYGRGNKIFIKDNYISPEDFTYDPTVEYDVFIDAESMNYRVTSYKVLENLYGISKVNNLYVTGVGDKGIILNTHNVTYNNVFVSGNTFIEGSDNAFNGRIYSTGTLSIFGDRNQYVQLLGNQLNIGYGFKGGDEPRKVEKNEKWDWNLNKPGIGGGTPGKGHGHGHNKPGSGTIIDASGNTSVVVVSKLRLVE